MKQLIFTAAFACLAIATRAQNDTTYHVTGPRTFTQLQVKEGGMTLINLTDAAEVASADKNTAKWDIAFSGKNILLNSGNNGPGIVAGQMVTNTFFGLTQAPAIGYLPDNGVVFVIGDKWTAADGVNPDRTKLIVIKKGNSYAKMEIISHKLTGSTHTYTFRYLMNSSTDLSQQLTKVFNLFAGNPNFTFFNLSKGVIVPFADSASTKWNLGFQTTNIITNSGTSGPGIDSTQIVQQSFAAVLEAPAKGYRVDNGTSYAVPSGSGNGWYTYDITVHSIKPTENRTIVVKTGGKNYSKIGINSYYIGAPASPTFLDISTARYYTFDYFYQADGTRDLRVGSESTRINELTALQPLFIYPNPAAAGQLFIQSPERSGKGVLYVSDIQGRLISEQTLNLAAGTTLPIELRDKGMYFIRLVADKEQFTSKLMVY